MRLDAALSSRGVELTEKQVTTHIGIWFRSVEDRKGGRTQRKQKKQEAAAAFLNEQEGGDASPNQDEEGQASRAGLTG